MLISTSLGAMVSVIEATVSLLLFFSLMVTSAESLGIGMRMTFSNDLFDVLASSYVCHSWKRVEREFL